MADGLDVQFIYVGDPMCSWCWGFAPVLANMADRYEIPIRVVVGGLRPGPSAEPLDEITRRTLTEHWRHVEEASGQPFDYTALARQGWTYDTELSATAVVTMRELDEPATLRFFERVQRAFYAERIDVTDISEYPSLLAGFDVDRTRFMDALASQEMKAAAWGDFAQARRLSVTGFPSLLLRIADEYLVVTRGYLPWATLEPAMTRWLRGRFGVGAEKLLAGGGAAAAAR